MTKFFRKHFSGKAGITELLVIAFPMVVSQACDTIMMFTDRLFLSHLSAIHMAATMTGGLTAFIFMTFALGLTGYSAAIVAQYFGAGRKEKCGVVISQAIIIALIAYPIIVSCIPIGHWLFELTGQSVTQTVLSKQYFNILMFGSIFGLLRICINSFFIGIGRTRIVMISSLLITVVNVFISYLLIFGKFGIPKFGMTGAAIGSVCGSALGLLFVVIAYSLAAKKFTEYKLFLTFHFDKQIMMKLLRLGTPGGVEFFLNLFAFNILILMLHSYGPNVAASVTIAFNWDLVSFIPLIGISIGVNSLVGRYMGAGSPDTAAIVTNSGVKVAVFYCGIMLLLFVVFPLQLVKVFVQDGNQSVIDLAVFMVRMVAIYVIADGFALVYSGALRGAGDTFWTMVISVSSHWFMVVEAILLVRVYKVDPKLTWTAFVFTIPLIASSYYFRYRYGYWKTIRVVDVAVDSTIGLVAEHARLCPVIASDIIPKDFNQESLKY